MEFFGRERDLDDLRAAYQAGSLILEGARGVGKSELMRRVEGPGVLRIDLQGTEAGVQALHARVRECLPRQPGLVQRIASFFDLGNQEPEPWLDLAAALRETARSERLVLMLDELHDWIDLTTRGGPQDAQVLVHRLQRLRNDVGPSASLVLAGSITLRSIPGLRSTLDENWHVYRLEPLRQAAGSALASDQLGHDAEDAACALIHARAGGNPRWIRELSARARAGSTTVTAESATRSLARFLDERPFEREIAHLQRRHGSRSSVMDRILETCAPSQRATLGLVAAAQAGPGSPGRAEALEALATLREEFFLVEEGADHRFVLPILGLWFARRRR